MPPYSMREFFAPFYPKDAKHRFIAMTMIRGYFDDSGTNAQSSIVIAAGIVISDEQHDLMREVWDTILQRNHLPHFHTTKLKSGRVPPYSDMSEAERELLLDQLVRLMSVRVKMSCSCAIPRSAYEATLSEEEKSRYGSPYALAAQYFWTCVRLWAERSNYTDPIPLVAESGDIGEEERLSVVFNKAMADPVLKRLFHLHSLTFGAKRDFVGLQAADIVANSTHDLATHYIAGGRPPSKWMRIVSDQMNKIPHHQLILTDKILRDELDQLNEYHREAIAAQKKQQEGETK